MTFFVIFQARKEQKQAGQGSEPARVVDPGLRDAHVSPFMRSVGPGTLPALRRPLQQPMLTPYRDVYFFCAYPGALMVLKGSFR